MAIRTILQEGSDILKKKSRPVEAFDARLAELLDDLRDTMRKAEGAGLAAPQVGILRRAAVAEADGKYLELVNPEIIETSGRQFEAEGCLSIDSSKNCKVKRPASVTVAAYGRDGEKYEFTATGLLARAVCHEIDHLDGILFIDRINKDGQ